MGIPQRNQPGVKLIVGLISSNKALLAKAQKSLTQKFGRIDNVSNFYLFDYTDYYQREFGKKLLRQFVSFERLIKQQDLVRIKLLTNLSEKRLSKNGSRQVNIDPGYITLAKLVLASTKDHQHRIYQQHGIFNEVTLRFVGKSFKPWDWTYPDYKQAESVEFFNNVRSIYKKQL